ncbi:hypothetical protein [Neisseria animaloris]|uniref:hypothetical protein n=2 Tax=Neisseria animaloris TaxID=326522 RepID=UPI0018D55BF4|nr:hypothetical protein [Neisseria animaloris]
MSAKETMQTHGIILEQYGQIANKLYRMGNKSKARIISKLVKEVAGQSFGTKAQNQYDTMRSNKPAYDK